MPMNSKVIVTNWVHQEVRDYLSRHCTLVANMDRDTRFTRDRIVTEGADASAILAFMPALAEADAHAKREAREAGIKHDGNFHELQSSNETSVVTRLLQL